KNPAAISLRAFALGFILSSSLLTTLYLSPGTALWRLPFFLLLLSLFHFLEFYTTALSNPSAATVSAFLLSSNGKAYNIAHGLAFLECFLHHHYFPTAYTDTLGLPAALHTPWLVLGAAMLLVGQATRTIAMMHAGTNFNHLIQHKKKKGHVLVTGGIYRYLRHPSYFGFFWWGMGTQVVLGNAVCLVGYAVVLRRFFRRRIEREETLLVGFFGMDYVRYRDRTSVGIPFI
ncbi:Isoprenylcysteine carboxyl methyltransferase family-domain-containing protein, partial [Usnea florida]